MSSARSRHRSQLDRFTGQDWTLPAAGRAPATSQAVAAARPRRNVCGPTGAPGTRPEEGTQVRVRIPLGLPQRVKAQTTTAGRQGLLRAGARARGRRRGWGPGGRRRPQVAREPGTLRRNPLGDSLGAREGAWVGSGESAAPLFCGWEGVGWGEARTGQGRTSAGAGEARDPARATTPKSLPQGGH
jgi:hypothetical protein